MSFNGMINLRHALNDEWVDGDYIYLPNGHVEQVFIEVLGCSCGSTTKNHKKACTLNMMQTTYSETNKSVEDFGFRLNGEGQIVPDIS